MPYIFCLFVFSMGLIELRVASHDHVEQDAALPALTGAFTHESLSKKLLKCQSSLKSCVIMCLKSSVSESCSWEGHALHAGDFPLLQHTWFKWIACDQNWFQTDMLNRTKSCKAGDPQVQGVNVPLTIFAKLSVTFHVHWGLRCIILLEYCWLWQTFCCSFCLEPLWSQVLWLLS